MANALTSHAEVKQSKPCSGPSGNYISVWTSDYYAIDVAVERLDADCKERVGVASVR
jgi:hypothetical protein